MNAMKEIRISKVTLNMSTVVKTKTKKRNTFGVAKGREIGVMTTLRGSEARELLARLIKSLEGGLKSSQFSARGNFSFGIEEYINIPGVTYDPEIGIMGFDVAVTLERPGYRVSKRRYAVGRVGKTHVIKPDEAIEWVKKEFSVEVS